MNATLPPDLALIRAAQTGDPAAIERLLATHKADLRRYARRYCLVDDVDDAVQESMLRISRQLPQLRVLAAFSGWALTTIKRECLRLLRLASAHDPMDEAVLARLATSGDAAVRVDLVRALESLPAHYLGIVLMRDFEELSISEIAAQLGETEPCVKSRLHRARAMVREYLATPE